MTRGSSEQLSCYHDPWGKNRKGLFDKEVTKNKVNIVQEPIHYVILCICEKEQQDAHFISLTCFNYTILSSVV